jgi:indole-3-acetate monooxygenase
MGVCRLVDGHATDGSPTLLCCHFDISDVEIIDNWYVSGLRGTGSCDFAVHDVFVPTSHTYAFPDAVPTQPGPVYRLPGFSVFSWTVSVVPLGIARVALESFAVLAACKGRSGNPQTLRDQETVQAEFGRAETRLAAARALLREAMTELLAAIGEGRTDQLRTRAKLRMSYAYAAETASRIVERLAVAAGTAALMKTGALERSLRDVHAASRHAAMAPQGYITGGRIALGLDTGPGRL